MYGPTPAMKFGPRWLKVLRQQMIDRSHARSHINHQVLRLKAVFRWATSEELLPGTVYESLRAVRGLRWGEDGVREAEPVKPVSDWDVRAVLGHLSCHVRAMVELQVLTGMRPGECCAMRVGQIETTGKVRVYRPPHHKTAHPGKTREIRNGPRAQLPRDFHPAALVFYNRFVEIYLLLSGAQGAAVRLVVRFGAI